MSEKNEKLTLQKPTLPKGCLTFRTLTKSEINDMAGASTPMKVGIGIHGRTNYVHGILGKPDREFQYQIMIAFDDEEKTTLFGTWKNTEHEINLQIIHVSELLSKRGFDVTVNRTPENND